MKVKSIRKFSLAVIAVVLTLCCYLCATSPRAFAEFDYHPNLTVGTELVGSDPSKWIHDGDFHTYQGTGYEFSVDFSSGSASDAKLTLTDGDYTGYYLYTTSSGTLRETGAVISVNYVFDSTLSSINELYIDSIDEGGMEINITAHDSGANTFYADGTADDICYGGIWANDCNISLSTANNSVITSSEDSLTAARVRFISAKSIEFDAKIAMGEINVVAQPRAGSVGDQSHVYLDCVFCMEEVNILPYAVLEIDEVRATSKNVVHVYGISCAGDDSNLFVRENGSVNIGVLRALAGFSSGSALIAETTAIRGFDEVDNWGGIYVRDLALVYENNDSTVTDPITAWSFGIYAEEKLENYGVIQILETAVSLDVAQGDPVPDIDRHSVEATGIYCGNSYTTANDCILIANPGSELCCGNDGSDFEVQVNAPNASAITINTHGIFVWGSAKVENARVEAKCGVVSGSAQSDSKLLLSGMYVLGSITVSKDSKVTASLNKEGDASGFAGSYKMHAISCDTLNVCDTSSVNCDGHDAIIPGEYDALEARSSAKLSNFASLVLWGPQSKTARIAGGSGVVELSPDYTVKVDYGSDPNVINSDTSLVDSDGDYYYDKFSYVRIYNHKSIEYLTIDGKRVCHTIGQNIAVYNDDGTLMDISNVTWSNDSQTLFMDGANLGAIKYYPPADSALNLVIELAPDSTNRIEGEFGINCDSNLTIKGLGELSVESLEEDDTVVVGAFTLDGGANVNIKANYDIDHALYAPGNVLVNDGTLNANAEIITNHDIVVEKQGTLDCIISDPGCSYCLLTSTAANIQGGKVVVRGRVNLENMTNVIYREQIVHGLGIGAGDGVIVDGGVLNVNTLSAGIITFGADIEVISGTLNVTSDEEAAITPNHFTSPPGTPGHGSLIVSDGDICATSNAMCAVAVYNLKMIGGRLHSICTNTTVDDPCGIIIYGDAELGDGVELTYPENGYIGQYSFYNTVLDSNGNPTAESIIETVGVDPNPVPVPDTGDLVLLLVAILSIIAGICAVSILSAKLRSCKA